MSIVYLYRRLKSTKTIWKRCSFQNGVFLVQTSATPVDANVDEKRSDLMSTRIHTCRALEHISKTMS